MILKFDSGDTTKSSGIFSQTEDSNTYQKIKNTLCEKRREVEEILKDQSISPEKREETALLLIEKKHNLEIFGVSEIDYQAYLATKENEESNQQPSLF